ncbi:MAG: aromatic amino acid ammonia-lyase [Patescibacteria group bacterium]
MKNINVGKKVSLNLEDCHKVGRMSHKVSLHKDSIKYIIESNEYLLENAFERMPIYGLNTQFGNQVNMLDNHLTDGFNEYRKSINDRQYNLIKSHNIGLGEEISEDIVRTSIFLRAHCLSQGYSGVRPVVIESLLNLLNLDIHPIIKRYGSIGASGDLIPLSSIASVLIGEDVLINYQGKKTKYNKISASLKLKKVELKVREGLALINGTSFLTAYAALSMYDLNRLFPQMLSAIAMSLESLCIIDSAYNSVVHQLKNHSGQIYINNFLNSFWKNSKLIRDLNTVRNENLESSKMKSDFGSVKNLQDFYSLRAVPQGFGVFYENLKKATLWVEEEINSVNDNPIIDVQNKSIYQGANFMGHYITEACDLIKIDIGQASTWMHAILANMVHPRKNYGLPSNLITNPEIYNGFRPVQILTASLTVQNRKLAQSQQSFMIPTEGDNQDVNSLAVHAAYDLKEAVLNLERITAILFLSSAQALELRGVQNSSLSSKNIYNKIRSKSQFVNLDRDLSQDIELIVEMMRNKQI